MADFEKTLYILRDEVAAMLLNRDEDGNVIVWARRQIAEGKESTHNGDCTKQCYTCRRCLADRAMADADKIIDIIATGVLKMLERRTELDWLKYGHNPFDPTNN